MHELSLAAGVLEMVLTAQRRDEFQRVAQLHLEVGSLACVEVDALRFALQAIGKGNCLEHAQIRIDTPPGSAWCAGCTLEVAITHLLDPCPDCGGPLTRQRGGEQLRVCDLVVHDD